MLLTQNKTIAFITCFFYECVSNKSNNKNKIYVSAPHILIIYCIHVYMNKSEYNLKHKIDELILHLTMTFTQ